MTAVTEYAVFARFPRTVHARNVGDRTAFRAAPASDATMCDDGTDRDLAKWSEKEIFAGRGHLEVEIAQDEATRWAFTVRDGKVARFETGQA